MASTWTSSGSTTSNYIKYVLWSCVWISCNWHRPISAILKLPSHSSGKAIVVDNDLHCQTCWWTRRTWHLAASVVQVKLSVYWQKSSDRKLHIANDLGCHLVFCHKCNSTSEVQQKLHLSFWHRKLQLSNSSDSLRQLMIWGDLVNRFKMVFFLCPNNEDVTPAHGMNC